jgi:hypothetical protein
MLAVWIFATLACTWSLGRTAWRQRQFSARLACYACAVFTSVVMTASGDKSYISGLAALMYACALLAGAETRLIPVILMFGKTVRWNTITVLAVELMCALAFRIWQYTKSKS